MLNLINSIKKRIKILKLNTKFGWQLETAHIANAWGALLSTFFFTFISITFFNILYGKYDNIVGYNKSELLFLMFVTQISYYTYWLISWRNARLLKNSVRDGSFDLLLTKPLPTLFYTSTKRIYLYEFFLNLVPNLLLVALNINFSNLNVTFVNLLFGIIIFIFGILAVDGLTFIFASLVFWLGDSSELIDFTIQAAGDSRTPYEGYSDGFKFSFTTFFPIIIVRVLTR